MKKEIKYASEYTAEEFKKRLKEQAQKCEAVENRSILFESTELGFNLGLERMGHGGGCFYQASITPADGGIVISGRIDSNAEKWHWYDYFAFALFWIAFSIPYLFFSIGNFLVSLFRRSPKKRKLKKEELLDLLMISYMGCRKMQ